MIKKIWREISRVMYIRWRFSGSGEMWFWLARIIRGRSQQVRTNKGVERESVAMWRPRKDQPVSIGLISQFRLNNAIIEL